MLLFTLALALAALAGSAETRKVIFDTDIGDDVDDAYALGLLLAIPDTQVLGVTTVFGETPKRSELTAKFLQVCGRRDIPIFTGRATNVRQILRQYDWAKGFASRAIKKTSAVEFMRREIEKSPGEITIIAVGPLTNVGDLLTKYPEVKSKIKRIVIMGGSVYVGYSNQPPINPEWNIKCDPAAARIVYQSGVPLVMAGLEVTTMLKLDAEMQKRVFGHGTPMTDAIAALTNLWGNGVPTLFDPMAVAYALDYLFCESEMRHVEVDDAGFTRIGTGTPNVTVLIKPQKEAFMEWYIAMLAPQNSEAYRLAVARRKR